MPPRRSAVKPGSTASTQASSQKHSQGSVVDTHMSDYPTPKSEENSQINHPYRFAAATLENLQNISNEPRKLLAAINNIASLGIKNEDLDLPKIVAVGDQSAGKSSAIAAISAISVPRKAGVCTRCPTHIILHTDEESSCRVSIEKQHVLDNNRWVTTQRSQVIHFADLTNSDDLQDILSRAQAAILNPHIDPKDFVSCAASDSILDDGTLMEFSPNLIRLEISGPDCPELTFYDLPGIFNQTSKEETKHLPAEVRKLVEGYIAPENHIILLATSMESDMENSTAGSLIRNIPGAKERSVGLLTKPDRLPDGNPAEPWRAILAGESYRLGHGYFVTKQPSQKDLDARVSVSDARESENTFFNETEPWCRELFAFNHQFGTAKLQAKLSNVLVSHIRDRIPSLVAQVQHRLSQIHQELSTLPVPPENALTTVIDRIYKIDSRLGEVFDGELTHLDFTLKWKRAYKGFADDMHSCRPTLVILTAEESGALKSAKMKTRKISNTQDTPISIDDNDVEEGSPCPLRPQIGQKRLNDEFTPSPNKRQRQTVSPATSSSTSSNSPNKYTLESLHEILSDHTTSAMGLVDHRAEEYIIRQTIEAWDAPLKTFIQSSKREMSEALHKLLDSELQDWKETLLHKEMHEQVNQWIDGSIEQVRKFATMLIAGEKLKPMTVNVEFKKQQDTKEVQTLQDYRKSFRARLAFEEGLVKQGKTMTDPDKEQKYLHEKEKMEKKLEPDPWEKELEIMGRVRGYYTMASTNFVDTVCKVMRLNLFQRCRNEMMNSVRTRFKLNGGGHNDSVYECERLLAEDSARAQKRQYLQKEKARFEQALKSLQEVCG